jgi:predicted DNA-binding WGR domain protein
MRDIDLVVSVAHRGEVDPEASASTIEMRAALIRETCQLLNLANVEIKQNHALIQGTYGMYSLHLGSGGIQLLPGGALVVLPVHSQHRGRLFLPFADDDPRTAEVISKVLLLARDEEIQDPTILDQLGHAVRRHGPPSKTGKRGEDRPSTKRRFEYQDGRSHKFWEIEHTGNSVTITWGRIGAKGQTKTNQYDDGTAAATVVERLIKEKLSKGYSEQSN